MLRLTEIEQKVIKSSIYKFDPAARIIIFGSRADPLKKGGDIDILILSEILNNECRRDIKFEIFKELEDQKIDIIIAKDDSDPFVKIALANGKLI